MHSDGGWPAGSGGQDWLASERQRLADARERAADDREQAADKREAHMDEPLESVGQGFDDLQQRAEQAITRANDRIARSQAAIERDGETQLRERAEQQRHELARQWAVIRASREPTDIQRRQDEAIAQSQELIKRAQELRGPFPATTSAPGGQQPSAIRDEDPSGGRPPGH